MRDESQVVRAIDEYGDMVRRICFLYLKNHSDAEDTFQEVFVKYLLHPGEFGEEEHRKAWLARVAINLCKDSLRRLLRLRTVPLEQAEAIEGAPPPEHTEVYDALRALPGRYRGVVYLFYYEGYTAVEIAGILGRSPNTVYTWLSRAKKLLEAALGGDDHD